MEYRQLGSTGLVVSRLGLGAMTFGVGDGPLQRLGAADAAELVSAALDVGVTLFNTASSYGGGQSETMLGAALKSVRDDVIIATKVGGVTGGAITSRGLSRRHIVSACEGSLRRLGVDYVDVLTAHHYDPYTPLWETLEALDALVRQGKVRYLGFGNWPAWLAAKAIGLQRENGWHRFCTSESYYSLVGREIEHELVPFCVDAGIGVTAWSPLAMGLLSGRYTPADPDGGGGRAAKLGTVPPVEPGHLQRVLDAVRVICADRGFTPAQVALAWLLRRDVIDSVLIGASSLAQLHENLAARSTDLSSEELATLDELTSPAPIYPAWLHQQLAELPGFLPSFTPKRL